MPLDPNKPTLAGETFYTIFEVSEGLDVSDRTVRNWIKSGELSAYRVGRQWRISDKDFKQFLRERWSA